MSGDRLYDVLAALATELAADGVRLTVAGGYGLLLRETHLREAGRTPRRPLPGAARSTRDLDLLLVADIVADADAMRRIREALDRLGFDVVPGRANYQFVERGLERGLGVKIDLLAGPVPEELASKVKYDSGREPRRVGPRTYSDLHGHPTPEALTAFDHTLEVPLGGPVVAVPHPFSHLVLKLYALRDRMWEKGREEGYEWGRHHAFDIYRILALMSHDEWREAEEIAGRYEASDVLRTANRYVSMLFADERAPGTKRVLDHAERTNWPVAPEDIRATVEDLAALFPAARAADPPPGGGPASAGVERAAALDDAKGLLIDSLAAAIAAVRGDLREELHADLDELARRSTLLLVTATELAAPLLRAKTWEDGLRALAREAGENADQMRAEVGRLLRPADAPTPRRQRR